MKLSKIFLRCSHNPPEMIWLKRGRNLFGFCPTCLQNTNDKFGLSSEETHIASLLTAYSTTTWGLPMEIAINTVNRIFGGEK